MRRRQLLYSAGIAGGVVVGGINVGTETAQSSMSDFTVSDIHFETDDSELEELWVTQLHAEASWTGFDAPADVVKASLDVSYEGETVEGASTYQAELAGDEYEGVVECQLPSVNLVSVFESETFTVEKEDAETFEFLFTLRTTVVDTSDHAFSSDSSDEATAVVIHSEDEIVDVLDSIVITTDGTEATIFNESDEDVTVTLKWVHHGHDDEETYTCVESNDKEVQEPPGQASGAPSYEIEAVGYELGGC